ncbi:MAG: outer membrane lipoprotein carrier protein LolA [Prevotellaceae bacterium]|jgi:outer membrane lipoprotein-sorting protein|nr:outer membrane lipoprotein carrier protein LolA [Prevotellaceae bacterium]
MRNVKRTVNNLRRRTLAAVCAMGMACVATGAAPPQNAKQLLAAFTEKINGATSLEMTFALTFENPAKGLLRNYEGTLLCSGAKYRLLTDESDIYSDGRNKWLCNKETNEVYIQYVSDDESVDITDNPLRFLASCQKDFNYKQKGDRREENGRTLVDIEFTPKNRQAAYTSIVLTLDAGTAYPNAILYVTKSGRYTIRITRITPDVEVFDGYFAFPKHRYPGIEIIDLR